MAHLTLEVLGTLQVIKDGAPITRFESDKVRALLVYLAVHADTPQRREKLTGLLWPDCPEQSARHNLSQTLFNLRQAIGDNKAKPSFLFATREEIQFNPASHYSLDLTDFNSHLAAVSTHKREHTQLCATCVQHLQQAVELYRGKFLEQFFLADSDVFEEWAVTQRESLHQRALDAFTQLAGYHEQQTDFEQARHYAARQLELDPWHEEAHRQLMRALALSGQRSAALTQYDTCRRVLADELGVEPSKETRELYEQIRAGKFEVVPRAQPTPPSNLLHAPTTFIGREAEMGTLNDLLRDLQCRLLTILGPGGIGKTRLAIETAATQRERFADGIFFVPLASISSPQFVAPAIADAIGFTFSGTVEPRAQLLNHLRDKTILLVLDNFEHLLDASELLAEILQRAPRVKLLVTSRERLNLQGEWLFDLRGLSVPSASQVDRIEKSSAVELFMQRARRIQPGITFKPTERLHVLRICQLVEGLPLAIELAATWVSILSLAEIAREIERNLDFLASTTRDVPGRHQSLRATFEHSWRLLSDNERNILCGLAIFQGGFQRDAAEQIVGASLPLLATLVSKSLVRRTESGRYDLHEVIRQYAQAHLADDSARETTIRNRHSEYYLEKLCCREKDLKSAALRETLRELTDEIDNLRVAWGWAIEHEKFAALGDAVMGLGRLFELGGWLTEGIQQIEPLVQALRRRAEDAERNRILGKALGQQALLYFRWGKFEHALVLFEESAALLRPLNDPAALAHSLVYSSVLKHLNGDIEKAQTYLREGFECARAARDDWFMAYALLNQGYIASLLGRYEEGYQQMTEAIAMWRKLGDPQVIALGLNFLSPTVVQLQRYAEAEANMRESLELCEQVGNRWGMGTAYRFWGLAALAQGKLEKAESLIYKSLAIYSEIVTGWDIAVCHIYLGEIKTAQNDPDEAKQIFEEALKMGMEIQAVPLVLDALIGLAGLHAQAGELEQALEFSICVANHSAATQEAKARAEKLIAELTPPMSAQQIETIQTQTRQKSFSEIIARVKVGDRARAHGNWAKR
ncbi:MAG: tetratricopeptide repeat protein [Chloroflexi bacterium]|nr:tetratricopeptide repeat protein [Chloroflexota bacterium]